MTQAGDWTPAMPLRADATDEQIKHRAGEIFDGQDTLDWIVAIAREFAAASQGTTRPSREQIADTICQHVSGSRIDYHTAADAVLALWDTPEDKPNE